MSEPALSVDLWVVWIREYGAKGAISLASSHGYSRDEIARVNRAAISRLTPAATPESPTTHNQD